MLLGIVKDREMSQLDMFSMWGSDYGVNMGFKELDHDWG